MPASRCKFKLTKTFSTMHHMFPSVTKVYHSCPREALISQTFRAPPASHDAVPHWHSISFLGRGWHKWCDRIPWLLPLNRHFFSWADGAGIAISCFWTLSDWICLADLFLLFHNEQQKVIKTWTYTKVTFQNLAACASKQLMMYSVRCNTWQFHAYLTA